MSKKSKPRHPHPTEANAANPQVALSEPADPESGLPWWRRVTREPIALLLSLIILVRPWSDGFVFPYHNAYFVWAICLLAAGWAVGALRRGDPIRSAIPLGLLASFMALATITGVNSIQPASTYRVLLWWAGHLGVFLIATNALRSRLAVGIVMAAFAVSSMYEAVYGVLHLQYKLPFMRMLVNLEHNAMSGPAAAQFANRLESNRAFGSFLFPNALAAFLVLGIPYAIGSAGRSYFQLREAQKLPSPPLDAAARNRRMLVSTCAGLAAWFIGFISASLAVFFVLSPYKYYSVQSYMGRTEPVSDPLMAHLTEWSLWIGVAPLIPAVAILCTVRRVGWWVAWPAIRLSFAVVLGCAELVALTLTYSRGGMLGLLAGLTVAALLLWFAKRNGPTPLSNGAWSRRLATASLALIVCLFAYSASTAGAESSSASPDSPEIDVHGNNYDLADTLDPSSFRLRLSYWKTGLHILERHYLSGVGLGNFEIAYPVYQRLGSGDVKMAHNDYLQIWCETGVFGLLLFVAFWGYFVLAGARRIVNEKNPADRWVLAGLYAGVLAFLAHAVVDFNFQNTSLAFFVFLLAGVFFSCTGAPCRPVKRRWAHQLAVLLILAIVPIVAGAQVRLRAVDNVLEDPKQLPQMFATAKDILDRTAPGAFDAAKPPRFHEPDVAQLIPSLADQQSFAKIMIVVNANARYLDPGETIPQSYDSRAFVEVHNPDAANAKTSAAIDYWVEQLEAIDASFPHSPRMASIIFQWCELRVNTTRDKDTKNRWILKALAWAEESVRRSPMGCGYRVLLGKALYMRAGIEPDAGLAVETLQRGLDQFREATNLYPTSEDMWDNYADALEKAGAAFKKVGDSVRGDALISEGQNAKVKAKGIADYKQQTHTGATG